jgi:negative regulator of flagellin synthesis FlgM
MKIDDKIINYEINKYLPKSPPNAAEKLDEKRVSDEQKVGGSADQDAIVNLSQASKEAQKIREIIASEPDVREDKVADLKERIESGRYTIDHAQVADKLVNELIDELL